MSLTYLASPYTHAEAVVRHQRFKLACEVAARMMMYGECVFSPIAHSHPIEQTGVIRCPDHAFWMKQDRAILKHADKLAVLMLDGWKDSKGVQEEIATATAMGIPIEYVCP